MDRPGPRDDEIEAILDVGRRTRTPLPRGLWIAAAVVGGVCAAGFAVAMLGDAAPARPAVEHRSRVEATTRATTASGFGTGLAIGAVGGLVAGYALARQRRDHSSRRSP